MWPSCISLIWQCFSILSLITFILDWANRRFLIAIFSFAAQTRVICLHLSTRRDRAWPSNAATSMWEDDRRRKDNHVIYSTWTWVWVCWVYHPNPIGILVLWEKNESMEKTMVIMCRQHMMDSFCQFAEAPLDTTAFHALGIGVVVRKLRPPFWILPREPRQGSSWWMLVT